MNLSHRLLGVCIAILTVALICGGCSVTTPHGSLPTVESQGGAARAVITGLTTETLRDHVRITVQSTEAVEYTSFTLHDPPRLVVTLTGATLGPQVQPMTGAGIVKHIDIAAVPEERAVRLVASLQSMTTHTVELQGPHLVVTLAEVQNPIAETVSPLPAERSLPLSASTPTPVTYRTAAAQTTGTTIHGINVAARAERSVVSVQTTGPAPKVQVKQLQQPDRLVLNIEPARLSPTQEPLVAVREPDGLITHVEATPVATGQEGAVKVVVHLRAAAAFEIQQDNEVVRLAVTKPLTEAAPLHTALSGGAPVGPLPRSSLALQPLTAPARIAQISPLVRRGAAPAAAAAPPSSAPARRAPDLPPGESLDQTPRYGGEKISLDFQDADINDILRLIAEVGGVNIIAGGDVQGKVTTRMVDVPWDQALDVILKINGLDQERSGNIIRVAPLEKFTNERKERLQARVTEVQTEPITTRVVAVNFAPAKDLRTNLEKLLSNRGTIFIDNRTNTLIVTDTQKHLDDVFSLVDKLDRPTPQVMIEARIVESSRNFLRELGAQLGLAYSQITNRVFPNRIDVRGGIPSATGGGGLTPPAAPANFLLDLPAAVATGSGGAIGFSLASIGGAILDAQLSALESSGRGKIISSPKIATLDNTEAQIQSGRKIPVATVSAEGTRTEFVDASITLKVTPHVTPNDFIGLKITATKNEADFGRVVNGVPTITTREANTDMLIKDGDTVVIGGLYRRTIQSSRAGIPGLSNLPVLGWLFRKEQEQDESDELLIFLTPRIIRQDDTLGKRRTALSN